MSASDAFRTVYTPSEINREARLHLEAGFPRLWIEGEISNFKRAASGHLYFALKDEQAAIDAAMFRGSQRELACKPAAGMLVRARGRLTLYERTGRYQLVVDAMEEAGEGRLQRAFEALKKQLEAEGLFDSARKRPLPAYPRRIAVVTSPAGAAIRDILNVLARRWPLARVRLYGVPVQGDEAPAAIVNAIESAGRHRWAELVIAGRGGGSLEDLWAFNDEQVARAIAACPVPVVSAVGHETDVSIADFVADLRAPTPSAAAELATPDRADLGRRFEAGLRQLAARQMQRLQREAQRLDHLAHRLNQCHPARVLDQQRRALAQLIARLRARDPRLQLERMARDIATLRLRADRAISRRVTAGGERLANLARTLHAVSPLPTLARGYAVLQESDGTALTRASDAKPGQALRAQLADGGIACTVTGTDDRRLD